MFSFIQKQLWKYALKLTSAFNTPSLLQARILMLYRRPSAQLSLVKFSFAVPMLALCMLITAFTQRERILPTALLQESEKVAQRFTQEMQKAFLPTSNEQASISETKNKEEAPEAATKKPTVSQVKTLSALSIALPAHVPKDLPALPEMVEIAPIEIVALSQESLQDDYKMKKEYQLKQQGKQKYSALLTKGNVYMFRVVSCESKAPILQTDVVNMNIYKRKGDEFVKTQISRNENGDFVFLPSHELDSKWQFCEIEFENMENATCLAVQMYEKEATAPEKAKQEGIDIVLINRATGKEVNFKKKIAIKKGLALVLGSENTGDLKDCVIKKVTAKMYGIPKDKKQKAVLLAEKTFSDSILDFSDWAIKGNCAVQISVEEVVRKKADGTTEPVKIAKPYISIYVR